MIATFRTYYLIFLCLSFTFIHTAKAQLAAHAGTDISICPGTNTQIGATIPATGGQPPYHYSWSPSTGLSATNVANPMASPASLTIYTLTVTDDTGAVSTDNIAVGLKYISKVNAGADREVCKGDNFMLGNTLNVIGQGIHYSWAPSTGLDNDTIPRPLASPTETITYTLTATMAGCTPKVTTVTIYFVSIDVSAGPDTTIDEGQSIQLEATGAYIYHWDASPTLRNAFTANPDAEPIVTTTYYVLGIDRTLQCSSGDSITVHVKPGDNVFFYNTFTPNGDDINDTWYIGNIWKHPDNTLQIFNRNGQLVFKQEGYNNTWDGKAFGQELPAATYFYILDLGNEAGDSYHGTVTIVK